ncbi:MAG TPA: YbaB/EbfC family nucleoid-associated protein [Pseudonocardiaceae bacterium]|jgi:hypothetical protein|nr:YbaB/EbfC family nucleoid-associated protein [Pseudonocardiaceae bacterium]
MATAYTTVDGDNAGQMRQVEDILIVHRMQDQLDQLRTGTAPSSGTTPAEPPVDAAEALDGAVRAEVTGGQVSALRIDPSALRVPTHSPPRSWKRPTPPWTRCGPR